MTKERRRAWGAIRPELNRGRMAVTPPLYLLSYGFTCSPSALNSHGNNAPVQRANLIHG